MKRLFMLTVALVLMGLQVHAQELPASVKGASLYPDNATCKGWQMFESFASERQIRDAVLVANLATVRQRLEGLCKTSPDRESIRSGAAVGWLSMADYTFDILAMSLFDRMNRPVSAADRVVLRDLLHTTVLFQREFELMRIDAYQAVREVVQVKESVKTVEVPVQIPCPAAEAPPVPRDSCADALRQGADRWSSQLYKWTGWYRGSGADWSLADSSKGDLRSIANGNGDPRSYVVGWLAQWRSIRRQDNTSLLGSGPMPQIAADMRAQLSSCGMYVQEEQ